MCDNTTIIANIVCDVNCIAYILDNISLDKWQNGKYDEIQFNHTQLLLYIRFFIFTFFSVPFCFLSYSWFILYFTQLLNTFFVLRMIAYAFERFKLASLSRCKAKRFILYHIIWLYCTWNIYFECYR